MALSTTLMLVGGVSVLLLMAIVPWLHDKELSLEAWDYKRHRED